MKKPYLICHMLCALDGRIDGAFMSAPENAPMLEAYANIRKQYQCPVIIYGAKTAAALFADGFVQDLPHTDVTFPRADRVSLHSAHNFIAAVDPCGTLAWNGGLITQKGRPTAHAVEILTETVSDDYIAYLRERGVSYIFAGKDALDCALMLEKLSDILKTSRVMLAGGAITNGSFLRAGLIDELSLIVSPLSDGCSDAPCVFQNEAAMRSAAASAFTLKSAEKIGKSGLWVRYLAAKQS